MEFPTFPNQLAALEGAQRGGFQLSLSDGTFWAFRTNRNFGRPFKLTLLRSGDFTWERQVGIRYVAVKNGRIVPFGEGKVQEVAL